MSEVVVTRTGRSSPRLTPRAESFRRSLLGVLMAHAFLIPFFVDVGNETIWVTTTDLLVGLIVVLGAALGCYRVSSLRSVPTWAPTMLLVAVHLLASLWAQNRFIALRESAMVVAVFAVYFVAAQIVRSDLDRSRLGWVLLISAGLLSLYSIPEAFRGDVGLGPGQIRIPGTLRHPNTFGAYLATVLPIVLAVTLRELMNRRLRGVVVGALSFSMCWIALLLTLSRGSWIGAGTGLILVLTLTFWRRWHVYLPGFIAGLLVITLAVGWMVNATTEVSLDKNPLIKRVISGPTEGDRGRVALLLASWGMFLDHPLLGVGPGNFGVRVSEYQYGARVVDHDFPHNFVAQIAAETGIIGLLALAWWAWSLVRRCYIGVKHALAQRSTTRSELVAFGGVGGVAAAAVTSLFAYPFMHGIWEPLVYALVLALVVPVGEQTARPDNQP